MENLVGRRLGPYDIREYIASGGMAEVYKGYHPELDRYVAIKIVGRHLEPDVGFNARFRREAKAIAKLRHPNIVQVYDFGAAEGGHYMVMEYIEGSDLADVLIDQQAANSLLPEEDITFMVRQIGLALDHAHSKGVIHRDVKPGNVMITRAGQAILTDFGLALLLSRTAEDSSAGTAFGTPEYIAPEQVTDSTRASHLSDIYSLGVVVYEMVTGRLPFQARSAIDLALKHVSDPPTDPREIDESIAPAVAVVIMKAMEKNPENRFKTGHAFATALERAYKDPDNVRLIDPPTRPIRKAEKPAPREPVVKRGMTGAEARAARERITAEMTAEERERQRQEAERKKAERRARRRKFLRVWGRTIVVLVIVAGLAAAAVYLLQSIGVVDINVGGGSPTAIVEEATDAPPAAADTGVTSTPTATSPPPTPDVPTSTPVLTATPLQQAEATAVPPVVLAPPEDGESAFRLLDAQPMRFIGAGLFTMGTNDTFRNNSDRPAHPVRLPDYWIDETEISNAQYSICVEDGPCLEPDEPEDVNTYFDPDFADYPATYITYDEAVVYCLWVANQTQQVVGLPTEAQWEKAARWDPVAEVAYDYPWGDEFPTPDRMRYNESNTLFPAAEVGSYPEGASPYGVLDMAGNVWEWVSDWFDADYYNVSGVLVNPAGPLTGTFRITRGGSWTRPGNLALSSLRNPTQPTAESGEIGFRCVTAGSRIPTESDIYAAPLDLVNALQTTLDEARADGANDGPTLDEWAGTLGELETGLRGSANAEVRGIILDRVTRIPIQVDNALLDPDLGYQLEQGLLWIESKIVESADG